MGFPVRVAILIKRIHCRLLQKRKSYYVPNRGQRRINLCTKVGDYEAYRGSSC